MLLQPDATLAASTHASARTSAVAAARAAAAEPTSVAAPVDAAAVATSARADYPGCREVVLPDGAVHRAAGH